MSALDQLAERMGIEPEFKDATGKIRRTDPKVSRSLLNSMGLGVENARKAQSMLRELERADAGCSLPPVMVVAESATRLAVPLTLPRGIEVVRWSVREEDGASREGEVSFSQLAPLRARKAELSRRVPPPRYPGSGEDRLSLAADRSARTRAR